MKRRTTYACKSGWHSNCIRFGVGAYCKCACHRRAPARHNKPHLRLHYRVLNDEPRVGQYRLVMVRGYPRALGRRSTNWANSRTVMQEAQRWR